MEYRNSRLYGICSAAWPFSIVVWFATPRLSRSASGSKPSDMACAQSAFARFSNQAWLQIPRLDGRPKASLATPNRPIPKLQALTCNGLVQQWIGVLRIEAVSTPKCSVQQWIGALRTEAVSTPKYRTLRISKGPNRNIPCKCSTWKNSPCRWWL